MFSVVIIEKVGNVKECAVKSFSELYKKAGFKTEEDFKSLHTWSLELENGRKYNISLFGKTKGRESTINKYEFPPPMDTKLIYGNCILANKDEDNNPLSLSAKEWEKIYESLFGGFEDLEDLEEEDEEEEEEDEDDDFDDLPKTKSGGYKKDGFVVDDDEVEEPDEDESNDDECEDTDNKKKSSLLSSRPLDEIYLDCHNELTEESYLSD
jgi:hypothetical protein